MASLYKVADFDRRLQSPFTMLVCGVTSSGKTTFTKELLEKQSMCIDKPISKVYYHYGIYQPAFNQMQRSIKNIQFREGVPENWEKEITGKEHTIIVIDDLMTEVFSNKEAAKLYTQGSHHRSISVITLTQTLFPKQLHARTISLNSQYLVLFKNPRDALQIKNLANQMFPGKERKERFLNVFTDATSKPHSYLMIDCKQTTPDEFRLRTGITEKYRHVAYLPATYPISI
jgi:hypothetical protein